MFTKSSMAIGAAGFCCNSWFCPFPNWPPLTRRLKLFEPEAAQMKHHHDCNLSDMSSERKKVLLRVKMAVVLSSLFMLMRFSSAWSISVLPDNRINPVFIHVLNPMHYMFPYIHNKNLNTHMKIYYSVCKKLLTQPSINCQSMIIPNVIFKWK